MQIEGWREKTIRLLADDLGPAAEILVDSAIEAVELPGGGISPYKYTQFLKALHAELPHNMERKEMCDMLCKSVLGGMLDWHKV